MRWGISFKVPTSQSILALPKPSEVRSISWLGRDIIRITYHFEYTPQNKKEWQRVAAIKVQIADAIKDVEFEDYEGDNYFDGKLYRISELGKHFNEFVKFPKPFFDGTPQAILCRHAKRLYYESKLHIEQLIFVSMWIKEIAPPNEIGRRKKDEGLRQVLRRANSALIFAQEHCENWDKKLSDKDLVKAHRKGAEKSHQIARDKNADKIKMAKELKKNGATQTDIAKELGVSSRTIIRWVKSV